MNAMEKEGKLGYMFYMRRDQESVRVENDKEYLTGKCQRPANATSKQVRFLTKNRLTAKK
jgi:hypothetical protein